VTFKVQRSRTLKVDCF